VSILGIIAPQSFPSRNTKNEDLTPMLAFKDVKGYLRERYRVHDERSEEVISMSTS